MSFVFEGYEVGERLYDGPGSHVHRARRRADDLPVILKVLKPAHPPPERLARFQREHETLRSLDIPAVVKALGLENDQRRWVLVQEDIGGASLDRALAGRRPSIRQKLALAIHVVDALGQLHEQRVVHKDINPANIVWNAETGRLAIIDFGISIRLPREHATLRHPDRLEGTLAYIAPEQTGRMNRDIDYRADYYSLGVTLYELFTGELPFITTDPMEMVHSHIARLPAAPDERAPEVPPMVSGVIMKLMAKMAEARYQSSYGIKADLSECLRRLGTSEAAGPIELGRSDVSERFQLPQKLYGRDAEIASLLASFDRVAEGAEGAGRVEMVLVTGYSGIGKSALVRELHRPITGRRGYFAAGKFDQLQRGTPYGAVAAAFRSLVRQLLGERAERLAEWRDRLLAALGPSGRLITDVVPELELIIGAQPPVPEVGALEAQNRFGLVFQSFIRAFARKEHPLVLFLDDLQWADSGSLKLIDVMMTNDRPGHLLLIGAYRDNEVDKAHPLTMTLDSLRKSGAALHEIHVPLLSREHVTQLVADVVHADPAVALPLADLVLRKTAGNPLFVTQLLKEVHDDGLLTLDRQRGQWLWDIDRIEACGITDNVVDLMLGKLRRLPEATQEALRLAACLGNRVSLQNLALIREQPLSDTFAALLPALAEELILPGSEPEIALPDVAGAPLAAKEYRFLHDRVQQAAYSFLDEGARKAVHLRAGRLLLRSASEEQREGRVFEIADQLNNGRDLITDPAERLELIRLDLLAGRKAKAATAYAAAREYLAIARDLLPPSAWQDDYELTYDVHRQLTEAESLVSNFAQAEALANELLARARSAVEKAEAYNLILAQQTLLTRYDIAANAARKGLAVLGIDFPTEGLEAAVGEESQRIQELLGDRPIASLLDMPAAEDPAARTALRILVNNIPATFYAYSNRLGYVLNVLKMVRLSLQYGPSPHAADVFGYYGHLLTIIHGQYKAGLEFGELSIRLSDRFKSFGEKCRACFVTADFVLPWSKPLRQAEAMNDEGYQAGLEAGEFLFGGYTLFYKLQHRFYEGQSLERVLADLPAFLQFARRAKNQLAIDFILSLRRPIGVLTGVSQEEMSEAEYLAACEKNQSGMAICYHHVCAVQTRYLLGDPAAALAAADTAESLIAAVAGNIAVAQHNFYTSLSLAALLPGAEGETRDKHAERLAANQAKMAGWAESCPENFAHMHLLVAAEQARLAGRHSDAVDLYERAIEDAHRNGFAQDAALAKELAGRSWLSRGKHSIGIGYLADAMYEFRQWGALAKVAALQAELPELTERPRPRRSTVTTTDEQDSSVLDLGSVLKASLAISTEIVLDKLLTTLMKIVIENAGAERGALLLANGGELFVHVDASAEAQRGAVVQILEPPPALLRYPALAESIITYVQRTQEIVLLAEADREGPFTQTPYVTERRPKSILVMPLSVQRKLIGVLYLENNLTAGAFTPSRTEVLKLLSSQIGISLENAVLYAEMEQRVTERTAELHRKNTDLEQALRDLEVAQAQLVLREKMASLGALTAGIAHELRNPFNFINNFAQLSKDLTTDLQEEIEAWATSKSSDGRAAIDSIVDDLRQNTASIEQHGRRVNGILNSMLIHTAGATEDRGQLDLNELVSQSAHLAHAAMRARHGAADVHVEEAYDKAIRSIEATGELGRAFINVMENACYATMQKQRTQGPGYRPEVRLSTVDLGSAVEVRIHDNGVGIAPGNVDKIFNPFFTTKPPGDGTGLGLSICYDIVVRKHGGSIRVDSKEGQYSEFTISLPRKAAAPPA